jgi:uncharacterized protein YgiM (DUF1202 family)
LSKSKHNYTQYANKNNENKHNAVEPKIDEVITTVAAPETPMEVKMVVEQSETAAVKPEPVVEAPKPEKPKTVTGIVVDCAKLNVRKAPAVNADVVCVLDKGSQVEINMPKSKKEWFSVCTAAGIEGYCMRKYVEVNL